MTVIYGEGIQTDEEWVEASVSAGFIERAGAGWMTLPDGKKLQGLKGVMAYFDDAPKVKEAIIQQVKDFEAGRIKSYIEQTDDNPTDDEVEEEMLRDEDIELDVEN